ncbi:hypothetical protein CRUP_018673, partial [Coryphaenoides rupestris]
TLGHLEKAVVLELTLKHVKALSTLLEQQQQKIQALQNGLQIDVPLRVPPEVLQYLANQESSRDLSTAHLVSHIHKVASDVLHRPAMSPRPPQPHSSSSSTSVQHQTSETQEKPQPAQQTQQARVPEGHAMNCVPVIQRTKAHGGPGEQSGSDTDTDSGYGGGEHEKLRLQPGASDKQAAIKQEDLHPLHHHHHLHQHQQHQHRDDKDEPRAKRSRCSSSEDEGVSAQRGVGSSYMSFSPNQPPFCMPFYLIPSAAAAAAAYLPMLEKCWYSGGMPVMYPPVMTASSAGSLQPEEFSTSSASSPSSSPSSSSLVRSPRAGSPAQHHQTPTMESPTLLHALKQIPHLNLETKD